MPKENYCRIASGYEPREQRLCMRRCSTYAGGGDAGFEDSRGRRQKKSPQENLDEGDVMLQSSQPSQETRPKVIAAIPCFNTEPFIADVVSKARKYVDQVIVVDDGSDDGTAEAARTAGAVVINHGSIRLGAGGFGTRHRR